MPTPLADFVQAIEPESSILLFGAGSSIPSGSPSVKAILDHLSKKYNQNSEGFTLSEFTQIIEQKSKDRKRLIRELKSPFSRNRPAGGMLNIPLYPWKSIYTTNYDTLIENSFQKRAIPLKVYKSNFDFGMATNSDTTRLFKLHGTIDEDVSLGHNSRIILTENDYQLANEYREHLFNTLKAELAESRLVIIGYSLADMDIKSIIQKAITLNSQAMTSGRISLLMYEPNYDRASLYESQGIEIIFGGIDEFFAEMSKKSPGPLFDFKERDDYLNHFPSLVPITMDVAHQIETGVPNPGKLFNGWPASYSDIDAKLTFDRTTAGRIFRSVQSDSILCAVLLGASGVGKTTAARQALLKLHGAGHLCWEHNGDYSLIPNDWIAVAELLKKADRRGTLLVDDAHGHLREINDLVDLLVERDIHSLSVITISTRNNWNPRVKTPNIYKGGSEFIMSKVDSDEIDSLLSLVEQNSAFRKLTESTFSGFSRSERRRRLVDRCDSDMFVCMKNIFASENFDDIILREYAELSTETQHVYRIVAALEHSGVRVHRQLIIRILGIPMTTILNVLGSLTDIVTEYTVDKKSHIYGWRGRHPVINSIIAKYKYNDQAAVIRLFDLVIDNILPTYPIEIRSIIELCNIETGVSRIPDKKIQNRLLRKMISTAPAERVPRHRLIRNLIDIGEFEQAATEIRIFDNDFRSDGPVARYKINLTVARATKTPGILLEDRVAILEEARQQAAAFVSRYSNTAAVFIAYCDVGFNLFKLTGRTDVFDDAMKQLKDAEGRLCEPMITNVIRSYERRAAGHSAKMIDNLEDNTVPEID